MPDTFLYFAYGSNMLSRRLIARTPSAVAVGTGFVEATRLVFDKVSRDGSGKADIEVSPDLEDRVYGVLFRISIDEEGALDRAEGSGYRRGLFQVFMADETVAAHSYVATEKEPTRRPYHWYKELVVAGAVEHDLPSRYLEWLRNVSSQPDPNPARCAENQAMLATPFS
jgi:gamma-glutamylcyclotransferase